MSYIRFLFPRKFSHPTEGLFLAPAEDCSLRLQQMDPLYKRTNRRTYNEFKEVRYHSTSSLILNQARVDRHMDREHSSECGVCGNKYLYDERAKFERHMEMVHNFSEVPLTDSEIENIDSRECRDIRNGPEDVNH